MNSPLLLQKGDHPRIRGTNYARHFLWKNPRGSSPHTRDKHGDRKYKGYTSRIIPAYAGQTLPLTRYSILSGDHPRIRGTNFIDLWIEPRYQGSSPHTRDKLFQFHVYVLLIGIIPAYAGQTTYPLATKAWPEDHPRIRGTNRKLYLYGGNMLGSSPHTRDKQLYGIYFSVTSGIIPAYAGQTSFEENFRSWFEDHPRIRGTNTKRSPKIKSPTADFDKIHSLLLPIHKSI